MPKIGPNKVSIDPKAYAARVTSAKKRVAQMDPATKAKLSEYFPKVTKKQIVKQAIGGKDVSAMEKRMVGKSKLTDKMPARKMPEGVKFPKNKNAVPNPPSNSKFRTATKAAAKTPAKPAVKPKAPAKKKVVQMPSKINPFKMTPAQKAEYLKNPDRYNG